MAEPQYEYKDEGGRRYRRPVAGTGGEHVWVEVKDAKSGSTLQGDLGYQKGSPPSADKEPQSRDYKSLAEYGAARKAWLEKKKAATTVQAQAKALASPAPPNP